MTAEQAASPRATNQAPSVRILVAEPEKTQGDDGFDVAAALRRLGRDATLELHRQPGAVTAALRQGVGDLVVLDQALGDEFWEALEVARSLAVPALAILRGDDDAVALEAYRRGAADCIVAGPEAADLLPIAALEQLRRLHRVPEVAPSKDLEREVDDLRRVNEHIIQNMNSALVLIAATGRVAYANPMAERLLGVGAGELVGAPVGEWFADAEHDGRHPLYTLETGEPVRGTEMVLTRSDGSLIPVGLSCAPMLDGKGAREGVVAILQDLTEIKQLQRQVLQTEKMASIGQLAAGIAHEINNPMGFIHANLCQLSEYLDDLQKVWERVDALRAAGSREQIDRDAVREAARELDAIIHEVDAGFLLDDFGTAIRESLEGSGRIREIVRDLRAFSHPDAGRQAPTDVNRALDSTAHIVWTMMKHSVVLTKHYDELPPVAGFPVQLQQVFMNLLVNAYQAIEARAAEEETFRGEIKLRTRVEGDDVVIEVGDDGTGIEPDAAARIFDPFYTTKEVGVGMGLGLSTSFTLVRQHGGSLSVDSEPGRGTTFEVRIPIGHDEALALSELPVVLLVDDERNILSALERSLRREGYELVTVGSAQAALEAMAERPFDLIVSDQKMPGTHGITFFAEIERAGELVPRVLLTGWPEEIPEEELRAAGVTALLPKPWDDAELKSTLRSCLAAPRRGAADEAAQVPRGSRLR